MCTIFKNTYDSWCQVMLFIAQICAFMYSGVDDMWTIYMIVSFHHITFYLICIVHISRIKVDCKMCHIICVILIELYVYIVSINCCTKQAEQDQIHNHAAVLYA